MTMANNIERYKRVRRKIKKSQNPLFEKWLKEWKEEAAKNESDMQYCFNKALKSLKKYPLKLNSGQECAILENFGSKICKMLDDKLEKFKAQHSESVTLGMTETILRNDSHSKLAINTNFNKMPNKKKRKSYEDTSNEIVEKQKTSVNKIKPSSYVPNYRSGPYAILITLLEKLKEDNFKGFMTKSELQNKAQDLCDASFKKPLPGSHYTAWSSIGVLIKKNLVIKQGNPAKFSLTEEGISLANKLKDLHVSFKVEMEPEFPAHHTSNCDSPPTKMKKMLKAEHISVDEHKPYTSKEFVSGCSQSSQSSLSCENKNLEPTSEPDETVFLLPGNFEIKLLVDTQERDNKFQQSNNMTMRELRNRNVNFEIRHLKAGDFIWIAKDLNSDHELVLPYVVERKRMDDLASSIKDGRFHEQKYRLKQSGVENLIYLVEKYGKESHRLGLPLPTLLQAVSNTQIIENFHVKITNSHNHSMRYLDCMTTQLHNIFKDKTLMSCKKSNLKSADLLDDIIPLLTFKDFNKGSEKNKKCTVRNMLMKHLLQLRGVSIEKATVITRLYPTPKALMEALKRPSGEKSIAELTYGGLNRSIGPTTAKQIHMLYTSLDLR